MPTDRETYSISMSASLMRDVEDFSDEHDLKKCEFFEIAARDLLGRENAVPERVNDASKSRTEQKLDEVMDRLDALHTVENDGSPTPRGAPEESEDHHNNIDDEDGVDVNDGDESEEPSFWDTLDEPGEALTWDELKELDGYVRENETWHDFEIHPDRVDKTKERREPVITAAHGIIRWHLVHPNSVDRDVMWHDFPDDDVVTVKTVLSDVAAETTSEHSLFHRSGSHYDAYIDGLLERFAPAPLSKREAITVPEWHETRYNQLDTILNLDPDSLAEWYIEGDGSAEFEFVEKIVDGVMARPQTDFANVPRKKHTDWEYITGYVVKRVALELVDAANANAENLAVETDEVKIKQAVLRRECDKGQPYLNIRRAVYEEMEDEIEVIGDRMSWEE